VRSKLWQPEDSRVAQVLRRTSARGLPRASRARSGAWRSAGRCYKREVTESDTDVLSVAELARRLRRAAEGVTGRAWVEGEVASLRRAASGHCYFALKDEREDALIDCVMYRYQAQRALRYLVDGARVQLAGRATVWAPRGRLQFVAEATRPAGRGALLEALEKLKEKLAAEGLFAPERKQPIPVSPKVVGVVTSASGAAFVDICTVALRRAAVRIVLSPAVVQGASAPRSIIAALEKIRRFPGLDVLIVGRGGGAEDDLMAFNDEAVVRAIADLDVPVISAVGHEVDVTLTDFVADKRAATPSEAAELAVPDDAVRRRALATAESSLLRAMKSRLLEDRSTVATLRSSLSDPRFVIAERQQYLDELRLQLERRTKRAVGRGATRHATLHQRLLARHPRVVVEVSLARLAPVRQALLGAARLRLERARGQLGTASARLGDLSPLTVLGRGYAIATDASGSAILDAEQVERGDDITVRVHRGALRARVTERVADGGEVDAGEPRGSEESTT